MNDTLLTGNWALVLAVVVASVAMIVVIAGVMRRSARGQLKRVRADFRKAQKSRDKAATTAEKLQRRLAKLGANADKVKPRLLQEAKDALQDARALEKIAHDRVLVAGNHLRRVINDEFPPAQQQKLRDRYMSVEERDKGPFSF
jgi:septal ring factor EnvC (AmiA/AmiB activator)